MPVNTTSTGATYGKSSDPLCPLGFHPQVRWPTRCKRCFRDYKEHSDETDKVKYSSLRGASVDDDDPWSSAGRRSGFQRSRSLDVTMMDSASRYGATPSAASATTSSYTSRTTTSTSSASDDMPQWKKNMLERQKREQEESSLTSTSKWSTSSTTTTPSTSSSSYTSRYSSTSGSSTSNATGEEDYVTRRRRERAEAEQEKSSVAASYRSRSVQPEPTAPEVTSYERYRRDEPDKATTTTTSSQSTPRVSFAEPEPKSKPSSNNSSYSKPSTSSSSNPSTSYSSSYKEEATKEEEKPKTPSWRSSAPTTPSTNTASTPGWKKPAPAPKEEEKPKEPSWKTPSWKKPKEEKKEVSSLGKISESSSTGTSSSTSRSWKKKASVSVSLDEETSSKTVGSTTSPLAKTPSSSDTYSSFNSSTGSSVSGDVSKVDTTKTDSLELQVKELRNEVSSLKQKNNLLAKEKDEMAKKPLSFESAKAAEASAELRKAKEKISEQELSVSKLEKERKGLSLKVKELEGVLEKRPQASETNKSIMELTTKLKFYENKLYSLESENKKLHYNVENLEGELEEVQDNFREDEADEYRSLKRDLETQSKNVRVLQFKLKKAERSVSELQAEKADLETKVKGGVGSSSMSSFDSQNKIRTLERELEQKTLLNTKYEQQIAELRTGGSKIGKQGPVLSRTGSVEKSVEDQLLKDLQDSIERENDLKEQLTMAEDEGTEMRKKLSRVEDENESLAQQLKRMAIKAKGTRRSPSPAYGRGAVIEKDEGISEDGEELSVSELKVQLEVTEGETSVLRKKIDNLLTENLKLTKEIREINTKLSDEKKKKTLSVSSYSRGPDKENSYYEQKIDELQTELNSTRVKLIEKDREVERLDAQVKSKSGSGKGKFSRSGSQEEDMQKKVQVIEQEASVLRDKVTKLEADNERLTNENKHGKYGKKPPSSTQEKLQMDKFALEEKVKQLESSLKEQTKKVSDLHDAAKYAKQDTSELDRLKKDKNNLEFEITRLKSSGEGDKRKVEKLEREVSVANDKSDKAQRELIAAEREKRRADEDKRRVENNMAKMEGDLRLITRERDRLRDESEQARQKNRDNLQQTQEGLKAFKEQIETLKNDLQEEKTKHRETRRSLDEKVYQLQADLRKAKADADDKTAAVVSDLEAKLADIDDKWGKSKRINQQRKDKIDNLEKQLEDAKMNTSSSSAELTSLKSKLREAERDIDSKAVQITELQKENQTKKSWGASSGNGQNLQSENDALKKQIEELKNNAKSSVGTSATSREVQALKKELKDTTSKYELMEEEWVTTKAKLTTEKEEMDGEYNSMKKDYDTIRGELSTLRQTYNVKADEWIKEKLDLQQRMKDLQDSLISSAGEGWESERDRFKQIIDDRDNQITQLKIEGDVARSQVSAIRKECDDLKLKLMDYEKMSKFQKVVNNDTAVTADLENKISELKKQMSTMERDQKGEMNMVKMKYDGKVAIMGEEIASLKSQAAKYRRERENYKEMLESAQKTRSGRTSGGDEISEFKHKVSDLQYQVQVMEDELSDAKLLASKTSAQAIAQKSTYEIQVAELNSKINELEEEALIESGRARIAGTRTKMELAWQKERESQKKLINELNTMARDLKATLLEVEKERDRERLESKRKIAGMKGAFEEEQDDTKKQITDLQYDLLELRDAHAKLRTTNEKLRRDKEKFERERDEFRFLVKDKSRTEQGEEKKVSRVLKDIEDFFAVVPKVLGDEALKQSNDISLQSRVDSSTKANFKKALLRLQDSKAELEAMHKMNEEEREKTAARRAMMKRTGSVEAEGQDSPGTRGHHPSSNSSRGERRFRKTLSVGETIAEADTLWKSTDSRGSNESLASNASIPLPIPVRTRSTAGAGSESGYSSDTYNTIRRLERDTSVDRLSTGSRESGMSTQSEWVAGEKKKKAGLIGKLKKLTKAGKEEKEFGSGSDISAVSVASSSVSAFQRAQQKRAASQDRSKSKERERQKNPAAANEPFEKYFGSAGNSSSRQSAPTSGGGATGGASGSTGSGATIPRTYRRF